MKFPKLIACVGLLASSQLIVKTIHGQTMLNKEANSIVKGANEITLDAKSKTIAFIKMTDESHIASSDAAKWLKSDILGSTETAYEFRIFKQEPDELGFTHFKFQQYYNNIPVEDAIYLVHCKNGQVVSANGVIYKNIKANTHAKLSKQAIFQKALAYVKAEKYAWQESKYKMKDPSNAAELVILKDKNSYKLAYKIDIYAIKPLKRVYLYIDAKNGTILKELNRIETTDVLGKASTMYSGIRNITTDSAGPNSFFLKETGRGNGIATYNMLNGTNRAAAIDFTNTNSFWNNPVDKAAYDAHLGAEATYDFYMTMFSRNSYDKAGGTMNNYVHYSTGYVNAFWDGAEMTYGDGDGVSTGPLTSLDVIAHELTHGYTQHSAALNYGGESGALNESFSDIFGNTIRQSVKQNANMDWMIGDELLIRGATGIPFRDMAHPKLYGQPNTYRGNYWDFATQEVHHNNGVQNFWYYLLAMGGTGVNDSGAVYSVNGIGIKDAIKIVYRSENNYLTPTSGYIQARSGSIQAAVDLFGPCSNQVIQTTNAWNAVGLGSKYKNAVTAGFTASSLYSCSAPATITFNSAASMNASTFKWYFGDGDTSTKSNPTHTYLAIGTYTVKLVVSGTSVCGNTLDSVIKNNYINITNNGNLVAATCTPTTVSYCCGYGITEVVFNTIDNKSPDGIEGYKDFSCSNTTEVSAGNLYTLNIATGSQSIESVAAWIDYNNDGIFSINEKILDTNQTYQNSTSTKIIIPATAVLNVPLRMRIGGDINTLDGCTNPQNGQYEDYSVIIRAGTTIPVASFTYFKACNGEVLFSTNSVLYAPNAWSWDFGDGNKSTLQAAFHTYSTAGNYNVVFKICNNYGCDSITQTINVGLNAGPKLAACFPRSIGSGLGISDFKFNTIHNSNISQGFQDFSCSMNTNIIAGQSYTLSITLGNNYNENVRAWIDYNNDGMFDNNTESVMSLNSVLGLNSSLVTISSQAAILNTPLRMRIADDYAVYPAPDGCSSPYYGQYQDYAVIIKPAINNTGIKNYASNDNDFVLFPNPASNHLNIFCSETKKSKLKIEISDVVGKLVFSNDIIITQNSTGFDLNFPDGIYQVHIIDLATQESLVKKLVIQH